MKKLTLYLASDEIRPRIALGLTAVAWIYTLILLTAIALSGHLSK